MINGELRVEFENNFWKKVVPISHPENNCIMFCTNMTDEIQNALYKINNCLIITNNEFEINDEIAKKNVIIYADNPKWKYAEILSDVYKKEDDRGYLNIKNSIISEESYSKFKDVIIGSNVFIDHDVSIDKNTIIMDGAKIYKNVSIGRDTYIGPNAVIGHKGFGIAVNDKNETIHIPHIGGVEIGSNVSIGALTTVASGTINPTVISDFVRIDDHVHVGHNVRAEKGTIITAASVLGRSILGEGSWVGLNSTIIQGVNIGKGALVGIGAVVTKDVKNKEIVAGNPAQNIDELKKIRKKIREL